MKILFIGDIVGEQGRNALEKYLPVLRKQLNPDSVIVNCENAAHGFGITPKICDELLDMGINALTTGNHVWDKSEIIPYIKKEPRLVRPINFPEGTPGNGVHTFKDHAGRYITVINAQGRLFMEALDDPFRAMDQVLKELKLGQGSNAIIVDFHAEATSEALCFGNYLDGRVSAVLGTHTHVPTADHRILPKGTAYQTDVGMTGCYDSIIGFDKEAPINGFVTKIRSGRLEPASGEGAVCGALMTIDDKTGLAQKIDPVRIGGNELSQTV